MSDPTRQHILWVLNCPYQNGSAGIIYLRLHCFQAIEHLVTVLALKLTGLIYICYGNFALQSSLLQFHPKSPVRKRPNSAAHHCGSGAGKRTNARSPAHQNAKSGHHHVHDPCHTKPIHQHPVEWGPS